MVRVNDYISYKVYPKGVKESVIEEDITLSGVSHIYPISKPNTKLLNGFLKRIGSLPKECDFKTQFVIYFVDYSKAPDREPPIRDYDWQKILRLSFNDLAFLFEFISQNTWQTLFELLIFAAE